MAFAIACRPAPVVPSSSDVGTRAVSGSRPKGRPYRSVTGRNAFSRIYQEGVRHRQGDLIVVTAPGDPGLPQAAVVAGKRVGTAVRRNRAKRRLRAALDRAPLAADTAYVVVAGPAVVDVEFDRLSRWLSGAIAGDRPLSKEESA